MLDNIDVAILTRVNELAQRYGLKPYDFVATIQPAGQANLHTLSYEVPASGNQLREERYQKMIDGVGVNKETGEIIASLDQIIDSLDEAIVAAPRLHNRF